MLSPVLWLGLGHLWAPGDLRSSPPVPTSGAGRHLHGARPAGVGLLSWSRRWPQSRAVRRPSPEPPGSVAQMQTPGLNRPSGQPVHTLDLSLGVTLNAMKRGWPSFGSFLAVRNSEQGAPFDGTECGGGNGSGCRTGHAGSLQKGVRGETGLSGRCVLSVMPPGGGGGSAMRVSCAEMAQGCSEPAKVGGCLSGPGWPHVWCGLCAAAPPSLMERLF